MSKTTKVKPIKSRDEIYAALVEQRNITDTFNQALAREVVDALVRGDLAEAVRALAMLPAPVVRADRSGRTVSSEQAREKLLQLVLNAKAADQFDIDQADHTELAAAQARIASLEDEVKHLRGVKPRQLPPPNAKAMAPVKPAEPVKSAAPAKPADAWNGPQDGCPSWLRPVPQVAPEDRPPAAPPQTRSGDETKAAMDRVNSDRSAFYQHLRPATHSEPWRDYVGPDGDISMRPRGGWGFP